MAFKANDRLFKVAEVARMVGVHPDTVRAWERLGKIPKAARDRANERVWTSAQVRAIIDWRARI